MNFDKNLLLKLGMMLVLLAAIVTPLAMTHEAPPKQWEIEGVAVSPKINRNKMFVYPESGVLNKGKYIPLRLQHQDGLATVVGHVTDLYLKNHRLHFKAVLQEDRETKSIVEKIHNGHIKGVSIGFIPYGEYGVDIVELSIVDVPADDEAQIETIKEIQP